MNNFFGVRPRLTQYCTIDHAVELLKSAKKIMVLTGAGVCRIIETSLLLLL